MSSIRNDLYLPDLHQALVLMHNQVIGFLMQQPYLQFRFKVPIAIYKDYGLSFSRARCRWAAMPS